MISVNVAAQKKLPHPTMQYASIQGTVSLQGEAASLDDVATVMHDLFAAAQAGVDQHLAEQLGAAKPSPSSSPQSSIPERPSATPQPRQASQPFRSNGQRRGPAPVTDSQLRFLKKLIDQTSASLPAILNQYQVGSLDQLTCRDGARLIDELKQVVA